MWDNFAAAQATNEDIGSGRYARKEAASESCSDPRYPWSAQGRLVDHEGPFPPDI